MKFLVSNFLNYKMVETRLVMEKYNEMLRIGRILSIRLSMGRRNYPWYNFGVTCGLRNQ
ncbi:hypothetical protein LINGRAPRIM_LOCUS489 [Linum grandiflorum]